MHALRRAHTAKAFCRITCGVQQKYEKNDTHCLIQALAKVKCTSVLHCRINVVESAVKVEDKYKVVNYIIC